jgi:hypothetical protein
MYVYQLLSVMAIVALVMYAAYRIRHFDVHVIAMLNAIKTKSAFNRDCLKYGREQSDIPEVVRRFLEHCCPPTCEHVSGVLIRQHGLFLTRLEVKNSWRKFKAEQSFSLDTRSSNIGMLWDARLPLLECSLLSWVTLRCVDMYNKGYGSMQVRIGPVAVVNEVTSS